MDPLTFVSTVSLGIFTLIGVVVTNRRVGKVRQENTEQHGDVNRNRLSSYQNIQDQHEAIMCKIDSVHQDVYKVIGTVAVLNHKIESHIRADH